MLTRHFRVSNGMLGSLRANPLFLTRVGLTRVAGMATETPKTNKPMVVNHELPDPEAEQRKSRLRLGAFAVIMTITLLGTFNYEKQSSPVIISTMYTLRRSPKAHEILGDNISFKSAVPWIRGPIQHVKGYVDIEFDVKGDKATGVVRLKADRENRQSEFMIHEWSLTSNDKVYDLLEESDAVNVMPKPARKDTSGV